MSDMKRNHTTLQVVAMILAGLFIAAVGTYTDNGGLQLAGALLVVVSLLVAIGQASKTK